MTFNCLRGLSTTTSIFPQVQFSSSFNITVFYISSIQYTSITKIEPHVFPQLGFKKTPFLPFLNTGFKVGGDNSLPIYSLHTSYTCFEVLQSKRHSILKKIYLYFFFWKKSVITLKFETLHVKCAIFRYIGNPQFLSSKCICKIPKVQFWWKTKWNDPEALYIFWFDMKEIYP